MARPDGQCRQQRVLAVPAMVCGGDDHGAGGAGSSDPLPLLQCRAGPEVLGRQLRVLAVPAIVVQEDDLVAVGAAPACKNDTSRSDRLDLRPGRDPEVDAGVALGSGAAGLNTKNWSVPGHAAIVLRPSAEPKAESSSSS